MGLYAVVAIVGGIVATNVVRAIERQGELTRDTLEEIQRELCEKLDNLSSNLNSIEEHTHSLVAKDVDLDV
jgi:hypothetical protein